MPGPDGRGAARHPGRACGTATSIPGRSVRATARLAAALAVSFEATCRTLGARRRPCFVTGTPIRDVGAIDRAAARDAARTSRPDDGCS